MPPELRRLAEEKIRLLREYCEELDEILAAYAASTLHRRALERLIQLIVECVSDIAFDLAASLGWPSSCSAREAIMNARTRGWFPTQAGERFEIRYVGIRNRIVHDYEKLDSARVLAEAPRILAEARAIADGVIEKLNQPDGA